MAFIALYYPPSDARSHFRPGTVVQVAGPVFHTYADAAAQLGEEEVDARKYRSHVMPYVLEVEKVRGGYAIVEVFEDDSRQANPRSKKAKMTPIGHLVSSDEGEQIQMPELLGIEGGDDYLYDPADAADTYGRFMGQHAPSGVSARKIASAFHAATTPPAKKREAEAKKEVREKAIRKVASSVDRDVQAHGYEGAIEKSEARLEAVKDALAAGEITAVEAAGPIALETKKQEILGILQRFCPQIGPEGTEAIYEVVKATFGGDERAATAGRVILEGVASKLLGHSVTVDDGEPAPVEPVAITVESASASGRRAATKASKPAGSPTLLAYLEAYKKAIRDGYSTKVSGGGSRGTDAEYLARSLYATVVRGVTEEIMKGGYDDSMRTAWAEVTGKPKQTFSFMALKALPHGTAPAAAAAAVEEEEAPVVVVEEEAPVKAKGVAAVKGGPAVTAFLKAHGAAFGDLDPKLVKAIVANALGVSPFPYDVPLATLRATTERVYAVLRKAGLAGPASVAPVAPAPKAAPVMEEPKAAGKEAERELERFVKIAADSVAKLRKSDVYRVLESIPQGRRAAVGSVLVMKRPDLEAEVLSSQDDLATEEAERSKARQAPAPAPVASKIDLSMNQWIAALLEKYPNIANGGPRAYDVDGLTPDGAESLLDHLAWARDSHRQFLALADYLKEAYPALRPGVEAALKSVESGANRWFDRHDSGKIMAVTPFTKNQIIDAVKETNTGVAQLYPLVRRLEEKAQKLYGVERLNALSEAQQAEIAVALDADAAGQAFSTGFPMTSKAIAERLMKVIAPPYVPRAAAPAPAPVAAPAPSSGNLVAEIDALTRQINELNGEIEDLSRDGGVSVTLIGQGGALKTAAKEALRLSRSPEGPDRVSSLRKRVADFAAAIEKAKAEKQEEKERVMQRAREIAARSAAPAPARELTPYEIERNKRDAEAAETQRLQELGRSVVPGIRGEESETAGRLWERLQRGDLDQSRWESWVEELKRANKIRPIPAPAAPAVDAEKAAQDRLMAQIQEANDKAMAALLAKLGG